MRGATRWRPVRATGIPIPGLPGREPLGVRLHHTMI
jgi:hypothetical protein